MAAYPHKLRPGDVVKDAKARYAQYQVMQFQDEVNIRALKEISPEVICALEALIDAINEANHHDSDD